MCRDWNLQREAHYIGSKSTLESRDKYVAKHQALGRGKPASPVEALELCKLVHRPALLRLTACCRINIIDTYHLHLNYYYYVRMLPCTAQVA